MWLQFSRSFIYYITRSWRLFDFYRLVNLKKKKIELILYVLFFRFIYVINIFLRGGESKTWAGSEAIMPLFTANKTSLDGTPFSSHKSPWELYETNIANENIYCISILYSITLCFSFKFNTPTMMNLPQVQCNL